MKKGLFFDRIDIFRHHSAVNKRIQNAFLILPHPTTPSPPKAYSTMMMAKSTDNGTVFLPGIEKGLFHGLTSGVNGCRTRGNYV